MYREYIDIDNILASDVDHDLQEAAYIVPKSGPVDPAHHLHLESTLWLDENFSALILEDDLLWCDAGDHISLWDDPHPGPLLFRD